VVDGSGESVAAEEPSVPRCSLEKVEGEKLERHPECDFVLRGGVDAHVLFDLGVIGEDHLLPASVWFLVICPIEFRLCVDFGFPLLFNPIRTFRHIDFGGACSASLRFASAFSHGVGSCYCCSVGCVTIVEGDERGLRREGHAGRQAIYIL